MDLLKRMGGQFHVDKRPDDTHLLPQRPVLDTNASGLAVGIGIMQNAPETSLIADLKIMNEPKFEKLSSTAFLRARGPNWCEKPRPFA
ncbi:hypothetical protein DdX_04780 [Ditylenchus destructor]|uniref:Uncharacterized protein n=1 Tax=Ditylenchus destructor TaxID=166010 RepID=A0AAD4ND58_9BILA|nr:hypothetical protein DdX_04780 [Ditylenchus destructor]